MLTAAPLLLRLRAAAYLVVCLTLMPLAATAQLIDTVEEPFVTKNDTVNQRLSIVNGFDVAILDPELMTNAGIRIESGFSAYYLHVVKTQKIFIDSAQVDNRGEDTYVAIIATSPSIRLEGDAIRSRALFLKAIVVGENTENKKTQYETKAEKYEREADSLEAAMKDAFMPEMGLKQRLELLRLMASNCRFFAEAYDELGSSQSGPALAKFFMKHYFNQSERFNIYTHPFGLPQVGREANLNKRGETPEEEAARTAAEQSGKGKKKKRR